MAHIDNFQVAGFQQKFQQIQSFKNVPPTFIIESLPNNIHYFIETIRIKSQSGDFFKLFNRRISNSIAETNKINVKFKR